MIGPCNLVERRDIALDEMARMGRRRWRAYEIDHHDLWLQTIERVAKSPGGSKSRPASPTVLYDGSASEGLAKRSPPSLYRRHNTLRYCALRAIAGLSFLKKKKAARTRDADGRSLGRKRPRALANSYVICSSKKTPGNTGGSRFVRELSQCLLLFARLTDRVAGLSLITAAALTQRCDGTSVNREIMIAAFIKAEHAEDQRLRPDVSSE
jgi:hypothetical protein